MKKPLGADLVIPALALGFAAYFFVSIADLAWEAKANGRDDRGIMVGLIALTIRSGVEVAKPRRPGVQPAVGRAIDGKRVGM